MFLKEWLRNWRDKRMCRRGDHDWSITLDENGTGADISDWLNIPEPSIFLDTAPTRHVIFTCQRPKCGIQKEFHRWAFLPGSGSLEYFFGKRWPQIRRD